MSTATTPKPARRRRRWLLRIAVGAVAVFGLWVGYFAYVGWQVQREWQEACAEAERLDPGWRGDDIAAARSDLPDERNSFVFARAAAMQKQTKVLLGINKLIDDEYSKTVPQHRHTERVVAALRERVAADGPALAAALALADYPEGRIPPPTSPLILSAATPPNFLIFELVKGLVVPQLVLQIEDGDFDAAAVTLRAMIHTSRPLADTPSLLSNLLASAIRSLAGSGVERMLGQGEPPATALSDLRRLMEQEVGRSLLPAFRGERALQENTMRALDDGRLRRAELVKAWPAPRRTGWPTVDAWISRILGDHFDRSNATAIVRYYTWTIERLKESPDSLIDRADEWAAQREHLPRMAKTSATYLSRYAVEMATVDARFRCVVPALAAEQFRQANGRWPASLDELVPTYLTAVPRDPFVVQPLRLASRPDGIVIYSVGDDKTDNGGDVVGGPQKGRDLGIRLWNVDQRRQPPLPPKPAPK